MTAPGEATTEQLLHRAGQGDAAARRQLWLRHRPRLRRLIALRLDRRLADRLDPSDVVRESLAEADRRLGDYLRRRPLPFYPWLRQLALERLTDLHRWHMRAGRRGVLLVQAALACLGKAERELLVLRHLEQLPAREIAAVLGISEASVHARHLRALERLRGLLAHELGEEEP
jgi:RNA polymerase sigma-70 factor (ECF subfamily)